VTIAIDWTQVAGALLIASGAAAAGWQWWRSRAIPSRQTPDADAGAVPVRSSDQRPPAGFSDHVSCIIAAAPAAEPAVVLGYLQAGLTEAETLRAEVKRMSGGAA